MAKNLYSMNAPIPIGLLGLSSPIITMNDIVAHATSMESIAHLAMFILFVFIATAYRGYLV